MNFEPYRIYLGAGICLGAAFLHPLLSPLAIMGLVLFISAVVTSDGIKQVAWGGLMVGTLKYAGALVWFWHAYPLNWLGVAPMATQLLLIGGVWLVNVTLIGASMATAALLLFYLHHKNYLYAFPIILVAGEILGSFIFSLYALGPGSSLNFDFSFGYVGYPTAFITGILPVGVCGGVYALSFFTAGVALLIYLIWFRDRQLKLFTNRALLMFLIFWLIASNWYLYQRPDKELEQDVIAISTRFDPGLLAETDGQELKQAEVRKAIAAGLQLNPDILLLPEDSRFVSSFTTADEIFDYLRQTSPAATTLVVDSSRATLNEDEVTLRAYLFDLESDQYHIIDKQHFVPQGEYLPYLFSWWLSLTSKEEFIAKVTADRSYRPGPANSYEDIPADIPSILFCFESVIPSGVAEISRPTDPGFILHPVSQAWFHDSKILRYQLDRMLRIQAVANNVNIIQAGNMAPTVLYQPDGSTGHGNVVSTGEYFSLHRFK